MLAALSSVTREWSEFGPPMIDTALKVEALKATVSVQSDRLFAASFIHIFLFFFFSRVSQSAGTSFVSNNSCLAAASPRGARGFPPTHTHLHFVHNQHFHSMKGTAAAALALTRRVKSCDTGSSLQATLHLQMSGSRVTHAGETLSLCNSVRGDGETSPSRGCWIIQMSHVGLCFVYVEWQKEAETPGRVTTLLQHWVATQHPPLQTQCAVRLWWGGGIRFHCCISVIQHTGFETEQEARGFKLLPPTAPHARWRHYVDLWQPSAAQALLLFSQSGHTRSCRRASSSARIRFQTTRKSKVWPATCKNDNWQLSSCL